MTADLIVPQTWDPDRTRQELTGAKATEMATDLAAYFRARDLSLAQSILDALWQAGYLKAAGESPVAKAAPNGSIAITSMPTRVTTRKVIRDKAGRIVETVDIEADA